MAVVRACADLVPDLVAALCAGDDEALHAAADRICELEEQADKVKHDMRVHLPCSLFMPVDRRDLLEILHAQDAIADTAQDIAEIFIERDMRLPPALDPILVELVAACVAVVSDAAEIIGRLDELLEVGFRGRQAEQVEALLDTLNKSEDRTDELEQALTRALFAIEDDLKPVTVMLWYQVIAWIGDLADHAEKVGNRLRLVIAR
ncbi:MAG: TIGR00153 family protein [Oligoflexia bacterium]|nr:TIGR00153 family protein [Oligoflexia bacterium]